MAIKPDATSAGPEMRNCQMKINAANDPRSKPFLPFALRFLDLLPQRFLLGKIDGKTYTGVVIVPGEEVLYQEDQYRGPPVHSVCLSSALTSSCQTTASVIRRNSRNGGRKFFRQSRSCGGAHGRRRRCDYSNVFSNNCAEKTLKP